MFEEVSTHLIVHLVAPTVVKLITPSSFSSVFQEFSLNGVSQKTVGKLSHRVIFFDDVVMSSSE